MFLSSKYSLGISAVEQQLSTYSFDMMFFLHFRNHYFFNISYFNKFIDCICKVTLGDGVKGSFFIQSDKMTPGDGVIGSFSRNKKEPVKKVINFHRLFHIQFNSAISIKAKTISNQPFQLIRTFPSFP